MIFEVVVIENDREGQKVAWREVFDSSYDAYRYHKNFNEIDDDTPNSYRMALEPKRIK